MISDRFYERRCSRRSTVVPVVLIDLDEQEMAILQRKRSEAVQRGFIAKTYNNNNNIDNLEVVVKRGHISSIMKLTYDSAGLEITRTDRHTRIHT